MPEKVIMLTLRLTPEEEVRLLRAVEFLERKIGYRARVYKTSLAAKGMNDLVDSILKEEDDAKSK
jgi:hypothetical protein